MDVKGIRGIVNKNPGNIKKGGPTDWDGTVGYDSLGHVQFIDWIFGYRAMCRCLANRFLKHGAHTIRDILTKPEPWTATAQDMALYIAHVARYMDRDADEELDLFRPSGLADDAMVLGQLMKAIASFEIISRFTSSPWDVDTGIRLYEHDFVQ